LLRHENKSERVNINMKTDIPVSVVYREGRPTLIDYLDAIQSLVDAARQLEPDGNPCSVCTDSGHQAWECRHNPLVMARKAAKNRLTWRCFHCGEVFTDIEAAKEHFGPDRDKPAKCQI
jgi:hypothetical protein